MPQKRLFYKIFSVSLLFIIFILIHFIPHEVIEIKDEVVVPHGSYGLPFAKMGPKTGKRVILIGNSVFQTSMPIPYLAHIKNYYGLDFEIGNFSLIGSSIADYLFTYYYIRQFKPDLVIVHMMPPTFGYDLPFYRTAARKLIFWPVMKPLWNDEILATFDKEELIDAFLYSHFPIYRTFQINRFYLKDRLNFYAVKLTGARFFDFFPYTTNKAVDWSIREEVTTLEGEEYPDAMKFFRMLVEQIAADGQHAVFIEQEHNLDRLEINAEIPNYLKNFKNISYYDNSRFYNKDHFGDSIHPDEQEAIEIAFRLLEIIRSHLK